MKNLIARSLSLGAALLFALTIRLPAQTTAFTYQGSLSNNGSPAAGNHDLRFRIYDALGNGNAVGEPLTNSAVAVANGLFTTSLDFGAGVFDGGNRWLEIGVRPAGSANDFTTLTPRQPLTATPYAVKALEATTVPQGTITSAMLADGAVTSAKIAPGAVNQLGSPDGAPLSALQVNTNGLVGIGTNAPQAGLHITAGDLIYGANIRFQVVAGSGSFTNFGAPNGVAVSGSLVAVPSYADSTVTLLNVSNPNSPVVLTQLRDGQAGYNALGGAYRASITGSLLAVSAANENAVTLIDVTDPSNPVMRAELRDGVGGFNDLAEAGGVAQFGNLLAIAAPSDDAVTLVDVSNPANPQLRAVLKDGQSGFDYLDRPWRLAFNGNLLAITAFSDSAITLVDVTIPSSPQMLAVVRDGINGFDRLSGTRDVAWSGNILVATALFDGSVTLMDCSNPTSPLLLREIIHGEDGINLNGVAELAVNGSLLAITASEADSVLLFDVSNAAKPDAVGVFKNGQNGLRFLDRSYAVAFAGAELIVTSQAGPKFGGMTILTPQAQQTGLISAGRVGIGTSAPASALHVVGSLLVEGANGIRMETTSVSIGVGTEASGYSSMAIGNNSAAVADYATAMGFSARAVHKGSFVWSDSSPAGLESSTNNQFNIRASGGCRLFSNSAATAGVSLAPNATAWSVISDRAVKKDFVAVDSREVLEKLAAMPVQSWHYQWESADATPHLGPVAQDFKAAFYPGRDDKSITTLEFDGVALAAIQGLNQKLEDKLEQKQTEITELRQQNAELLKRLEAIEARLR